MTDLATAVDRLHAVPLEDFVAERKRLAKELRAAGERDAAGELAKLPKPSAPAWALNHLAREEPEVVRPWLEAASALREASARAGAGGGDTLRGAMAEHREATRSLLAALRERARPNGRALSEPMLERVRELLQAATVDPDESERLRAGLIVEGGEDVAALAAAALGAIAGPAERGASAERDTATKGGRKTRAGETPAGKTRGDDTGAGKAAAGKTRAANTGAEDARAGKARAEEERRTKARAELEARVAEAEERLAALRDEAAELGSAAAGAEERLEEAQRTLHRSESEAAAARDAAGAAADAAEQAERELRTLSAKLES